MPTLWFFIVAFMLTAYVILDGFDIGAGIIQLIIGKTDEERRVVLRSIGPVWDGNEVWLLAAGGTLYFAFPLLYASSFSGFYLPLMMVLWLLMLRGIGIELRNHMGSPVWRTFFDGIFSLASVLLAIFYGAAIGNVVRGVPLGKDGYFFEPLWTNWRVGPNPGILDWYTVLTALVALAVLTMHGALYVTTKTENELNARARRVATYAWPAVLAVTFLSLAATIYVRPHAAENYRSYPIAMLVPVVVFVSLALILYFHSTRREKAAFVCSSIYIAGMLVGAAVALYPYVLPASVESPNGANSGLQWGLTIHNTATSNYGLSVGLVWWTIGLVLALGYFFFIYRMFRGKVRLQEGEEGY